MNEMKDDEEMIGQDSPDDSENDLIDAEVEQEESSHSLENENQNVLEDGESPQEVSVDNNVEMLNEEAHLSDNPEGSVEPHPDPTIDGNTDAHENRLDESKNASDDDDDDTGPANQLEAADIKEEVSDTKAKYENGEESENKVNGSNAAELDMSEEKDVKESMKHGVATERYQANMEPLKQSFPVEQHIAAGGDESGTEEEQAAFMKELENFFRERSMEFKPPKFYGEGLNCLKLWRAVTRLGGYDQVTSCKLWRQVGESFKPPKTCTTVSWSFRCFYEKALLDYERHKMHGGELPIPITSFADPMSVENQMGSNQASGSGRARRDAAARAMQGWHSQRLLGNGEVGDPIIKDKNSISLPKREKQLKSVGLLKRKKPSSLERAVKAARTIVKEAKPQFDFSYKAMLVKYTLRKKEMDTMVVDIGPSADWVKINVRRTKDCFEVYALVPGLLREEVRVQSDPAGRLVISGEPEQPDNPWGVTPFKKVITLPSRIDPHQTSAVVTLHGQLFVRVPFEQSDL